LHQNERNEKTRREILVGAGASALTGQSLSGQASQIDYSLQGLIKEIKVPDSITVVGTGGVGAWFALYAAMCGVPRLTVLDASNVDAKDVARTPFAPKQIGQSKAQAIRELIMQVRPEARVEAQKLFFEIGKHDSILHGLVFDGASDQKLADGLPDLAKRKGLRYISAVYYGLNVGSLDFTPRNMKVRKGDDPVWVGSAAMAAAMALHSAFVKPVNFYGSIDKLNTSSKLLSANDVAK
jgi:hypothetical protein